MSEGFWMVHHDDLAALLSRKDLKWEVVRVYLAVADLTVGYSKARDIVSLGQIEKKSSVDRRHLTRALDQLTNLGLYGQREVTPRKVERWVVWPPIDSTCVGTSTVAGTSANHSTAPGTKDGTEAGTPQEKENPRKISDIEKDLFEQARKAYAGTKRGLDTELNEFRKKHDDWREVLAFLLPAIKAQIKWRETASAGEFRPSWKHFKTWLSQRDWELETPGNVTIAGEPPKPAGPNPRLLALKEMKHINATN